MLGTRARWRGRPGRLGHDGGLTGRSARHPRAPGGRTVQSWPVARHDSGCAVAVPTPNPLTVAITALGGLALGLRRRRRPLATAEKAPPGRGAAPRRGTAAAKGAGPPPGAGANTGAGRAIVAAGAA